MNRDVERIAVNRNDATHARIAELVARNAKYNQMLDAYFREITEAKEAARAERSAWDGPIFEPLVEAAFHVWDTRGAKETRVELERVGPIPMMELET